MLDMSLGVLDPREGCSRTSRTPPHPGRGSAQILGLVLGEDPDVFPPEPPGQSLCGHITTLCAAQRLPWGLAWTLLCPRG